MIVRAAPYQPPVATDLPKRAERPSRVHSGLGMLQAEVGKGTMLSALSQNEFEHPWSVYDIEWRTYKRDKADVSSWTLRIKPGFVNGIDPLAFGVFATGGTVAMTGRGKGSALNNVGGAALEFGGGDGQNLDQTAGSEPGFYPLLQGPIIPVTSFVEPTRIPPFFKDLGVGDAVEPRGLLRRDVFLQTARAQFKPSATIIGNLLTGQLVEYGVGFDTTLLNALGNRPRIVQGDFFKEELDRQSARADFESRLALGGPNDDAMDRQFLFSFWLLGPAKKLPIYEESTAVGADDPPDYSQWSPYIEYGAAGYGGGWWNFHHAAKNDPPRRFPQLVVDPFLAFFVGRYTIAPMATFGAMEAERQRIFNAALNETSNEGKFWT